MENTMQNSSDKKEMTFTGERYVPALEGQIAYEHLHRYALACHLVSGKTVLDIACGEGYGSNLLSNVAQKVIGVDLSDEAVTHARNKYSHQTNLEFHAGSCLNIPCESGIFDVVVSFETIEHIAEHDKMIDEVKRVLKPDGILIISSPNKKTYTDDVGNVNEFHVKELYLEEFRDLLSKRFKYVELTGQRLSFSSHIWPLNNAHCEFKHYSGDSSGLISTISAPYEPLYFIAVCSDLSGVMQGNRQASLFTAKNDFLHNYYYQVIAQLADRDRQIADRDRQIAELLNSWSWKITAPLRRALKVFLKER